MFIILFSLPSLLLACGSREPTSMNTLLNRVIGGGEGVLCSTENTRIRVAAAKITGRRRDVMWRFMTYLGSSRESSPRLTAAETNKVTNPAQSSLRNIFLSTYKFAESVCVIIRWKSLQEKLKFINTIDSTLSLVDKITWLNDFVGEHKWKKIKVFNIFIGKYNNY